MTKPRTALDLASNLPLPAYAAASLLSVDWVEKVLAFHRFFNVPIGGFEEGKDPQFTHMDNARVALRLGFQIEELKEAFKKGFGIDLLINFTVPDSLNRQAYGFQFSENELKLALDRASHEGQTRDGKEVADAALDSIYFWIGFLIEQGYDLRNVMNEGHASNLTKAAEDGTAIINGVTEGYRIGEPKHRSHEGHGKVLKGPNFMEPNIPAALGWKN